MTGTEALPLCEDKLLNVGCCPPFQRIISL